MQENRQKPILQQIIFTLIAIVLVGMICVGAYGYMLMNNPDIITLGVGESYTLTPQKTQFIVRSYDANVITPTSGSAITANAVTPHFRYLLFIFNFMRFTSAQYIFYEFMITYKIKYFYC